MKRKLLVISLSLMVILLGGCASLKPIPLDRQFWQKHEGDRVGVVLFPYPPAETIVNVSDTGPYTRVSQYIYGGTLQSPDMDSAPRFTEEMRIQQAAQQLDVREFSRLQGLFVKGLNERGFNAFKVGQPGNTKAIPTFKGVQDKDTYESRDFRAFGKAQGADYLVLIELTSYGPACNYIDLNSYSAEVRAHARAELLDVSTNRILWRTGWSQGEFQKTVNASCSVPEQIPVIMDAQKRLLDDAADALSRDFFLESQ
ncbi:MAG TPA: hypothetical protein VMU10_09025 [Desulfomonilia bacterium]|nr:hypothetical protein [Desulfomonilia bacterium]